MEEQKIKIDESLIPMNFSWRAGIGTRVDDVAQTFEIQKSEQQYSRNRLERQQLDEFNNSLWWSLVADIEDSVKQYLFEPICEQTCESIKATIIQIIDSNMTKYPIMKSYSFQKYLKEIRKQVIDELLIELESYQGKHTTCCDGWIYIISDCNTLLLNKNKILNYILFDY